MTIFEICQAGDLEKILETHASGFLQQCIDAGIISPTMMFITSAYSKNTAFPKWVATTFPEDVDIHASNNIAFRYSILHGKLDLANWILEYSSTKIDISIAEIDAIRRMTDEHSGDSLIWYTKAQGHLPDLTREDNLLLRSLVKERNLPALQWILSVDPNIDLTFDKGALLVIAAEYKSLEIFQWLLFDSGQNFDCREVSFYPYQKDCVKIHEDVKRVQELFGVDNWRENYEVLGQVKVLNTSTRRI